MDYTGHYDSLSRSGREFRERGIKYSTFVGRLIFIPRGADGNRHDSF
jgi:hypothetical protein